MIADFLHNEWPILRKISWEQIGWDKVAASEVGAHWLRWDKKLNQNGLRKGKERKRNGGMTSNQHYLVRERGKGCSPQNGFSRFARKEGERWNGNWRIMLFGITNGPYPFVMINPSFITLLLLNSAIFYIIQFGQ